MKKSKISLLVVMLLLVTMLSACGGGAGDEVGGENGGDPGDVGGETGGEPADDVISVALILPGKIDDVSFNQAMYDGMMNIKAEMGDKLDFTYTEEVYEVSDIEPALRDYASEGYDLVIGHGFQFMEPIIQVSESFPDTMFALGTGYKTNINTCVYDVHLQEGGYLMGTIAGLITETNKIGVIGGVDVSEIFRGHEGFKYAARQVNPDIEIQELYTGDWTDSAKAKEGAVAMYDAGVDVIWHSGDGIGIGAVQAAKETDNIVLGNVVDQEALAPDNAISGLVYNWDEVIRNMISDIQNDNFLNREEKFYWISMENGGLTYAPFTGKYAERITDDINAKIEETFKGLQDGTVEMPDFEAEE